MRAARIYGVGTSYYHVISRVVDRRFIFGPIEKQAFRDMMRKQARFAGVEILTYATLSNHFHILLRVPAAQPICDDELEARLCAIYSAAQAKSIRGEIQHHLKTGNIDRAEEVRARYVARMYDLSVFMKELKQRFSTWYNHRNERKGTLWEERFKSVLVEGDGHPLMTMAAYIDLNAVRAGLCTEPAEYRDCGYGEAVAGNRLAREGLIELCRCFGPCAGWREASAMYRRLLLQPDTPTERPRAQVAAELTRAEVLRIRVRYLTDGVVLGSRNFVEDVFQRCRSRFGHRRREGARPMEGADWGDLCVILDLRQNIYGV